MHARLRCAMAIMGRHRAQLKFRDPFVDFGIASTPVQALVGSPPYRRHLGPYLSEHGNYISLHFGGSTTDGVHAIMDRNAPNHLVFSYTAIMAGFVRFVPAPRTIGMVGLGGGSLAKYCYQKFPESRIVVAEIDAEVIALRRHFQIPDDGTRFSVLQKDGAAFVRESREDFDVLLIDAFDVNGSLPQFGTTRFYRRCRRALTKDGVLVLNFSGETWKTCFRRLDRVFRKRTVLYQCPDGDNVIAFASNR